MDQRGDARRQELERKKQKLAEIRRLKQQQELQQLAPVGANARAAPAQDIDVDQVLQEAGVDPGAPPLLAREPSPAVQVVAVAAAARPMSISTQNLEITQTQQIAIQTKEITSYSKTTQTDDEPRYSGCEFSEGSQEFAFDDYSIGERHEIDFDESPTREIANILPHFTLRKPGDEPIEEERSVDQRVPELSEEEKKRIALNPHFTQFIQQGTRIFERIIAEESERDVMIDYAHDAAIDDHHDNGQKLTKVREFVDKDWSEGRYVTAMDYSDSHPELIVVAYSANKDKPLDPEGVVQVWNTRFKKDTPEYTFSSPSKIVSVCFARFHSYLILGGCYSGQICMWDMRNAATKKTPANKSPLSQPCHTHPVYCLKVIGSQNAHNLISISTDGRLCSWSIENLTAPFSYNDILQKQKAVNVMSMSFAPSEVNSFVVGSEEGVVYPCSRHGQGQQGGVIDTFEGLHNAPVSAVDVYRVSSQASGDYSHLFLSCSIDWTVKLWSLKDEKKPMLRSFDKHTDYVMDVAWHPTHPAVFASIDAAGNLFLWNMNDDLESPIVQLKLPEPDVALRKLMWTENGKQLAIGDGKGRVHLYDIHDSIGNVKPEEYTRFGRTIKEIYRAAAEADEVQNEEFLPNMHRVASGVGAAMGNGIASNTAAPAANVSPRQNY